MNKVTELHAIVKHWQWSDKFVVRYVKCMYPLGKKTSENTSKQYLLLGDILMFKGSEIFKYYEKGLPSLRAKFFPQYVFLENTNIVIIVAICA